MRYLSAGLILLSLFALWPGSARGGIDLWTTAGPLGGQVDSAAVSAAEPDVFYAASHRSVYRSIDAGQTWTEAGAGLFGFEPGDIRISASPSQAGRLLAAGGRSVYLSTDGGRSWDRSDTGLPVSGSFQTTEVAFSRAQPQVAYLGTREGLYRSGDGGETWTRIGTSLPDRIDHIALAPNDANELLVWAGNRDTALFPASLYRSTDAQNFTPVTGPWDGQGPIRDELLLLAFNGNTPGTVFLAGDFGNFRSLDAGQSFSPISSLPLGASQRLQGMDYAPGIAGFLLFGTSRGVLRSTDNGANFSASNNGLSVAGSLPASIGSVLLRPGSVSRVIAFSLSSDVFASDNGGASWVAASGGLVGTRINSVAVHPQLPAVVLAGIGNSRRDTVSASLYGSLDTAGSWLRGNTNLGLDNVNRIIFDPAAPAQLNQTVVYAAGLDFAPIGLAPGDYRGGLFKSSNGGLDWAPADNLSPMPVLGPVSLGQVWDVAFNPLQVSAGETQNLFFAASGLIRCVNDAPALTVSRIWASPNAAASFFERDGLPLGVCSDGRALYPVPRNLLFFIQSDTPYLFAGTILKDFCAECGDDALNASNGVFLSTDNGQTWSPANNGLPTLPDGTVYDVAAIAMDTVFNDIFVALNPPGDPLGRGRIFRSFDQGQSWVPFDDGLSGSNVRALLFDDPGGGRLFAALDGSPTNPGGVFVRNDGSPSWLSINVGLPPDSANALAISSPDFGRPTFHLGTERGVWSLTKQPDGDRDGPSDSDENLAPNGGDGNNDSIGDNNQTEVASLVDFRPDPLQRSPEGAAKRATIGNINLRSAEGNLECVQLLDAHQPPTEKTRADGQFNYPAGLYRFEFENCTTALVEIIFHDDSFPEHAQFRRFGPSIVGDALSMRWLPMGSDAQRSGNRWQLTLNDNSPGDLRSDAGRILFLGGPAVGDILFRDGFESP